MSRKVKGFILTPGSVHVCYSWCFIRPQATIADTYFSSSESDELVRKITSKSETIHRYLPQGEINKNQY